MLSSFPSLQFAVRRAVRATLDVATDPNLNVSGIHQWLQSLLSCRLARETPPRYRNR